MSMWSLSQEKKEELLRRRDEKVTLNQNLSWPWVLASSRSFSLLIANFRYIKYSASLRGCEEMKFPKKYLLIPLGLGVISLVSASQLRIEVRILIYRKRPILKPGTQYCYRMGWGRRLVLRPFYFPLIHQFRLSIRTPLFKS
jgi:hypothetical protein